MFEREVRYCTTEDGVRIAYCVEGEGVPTILALPAFNETFSLDHLMPARIAARAGGGEILASDVVRHLLAGKSFVFADRGEFVPKGFDDAVRLFEVRWQSFDSPSAAAPGGSG